MGVDDIANVWLRAKFEKIHTNSDGILTARRRERRGADEKGTVEAG